MAITYTLFECRDLLVGKCVRFGNDGNQVDLSVKSAHNFDIQWLQRVASWLHEVDTGVHAIVDDVHPVHLVLSVEVSIKALFDVLNDWSPRVIVVHEIAKSRGIYNGQTKAHAVLLDIGGDGLYADGLWCKVERRLLALFWWIERGVEQSVDKSGLAKTRFTCIWSASLCIT